MYYILNEATEVAKTAWDVWAPVAVQAMVTIAAIFGGAGFWQYKQAKFQAQQEEKSKKIGVESKVDTLTTIVTNLNTKVDDLGNDIRLLEQANTETIKYREQREKADAENSAIQQAVIDSLAGILRERLLENYKRCIKKGYYSEKEREVYKEMYKCYTEPPFNGNGVIHDLQPIMVNLPWTAEDAGKLNDPDSED